jgi:hypothetical protein
VEFEAVFITQIENLLLLILEKRGILSLCERVNKDIRSRYKILARESGDTISCDLHMYLKGHVMVLE